MFRTQKLFAVLTLFSALLLAGCDDSLPGAPFFSIPPGPNGLIAYSTGSSADPLKTEAHLIDSNGIILHELGSGFIFSKPGKTDLVWTILRASLETEIWQGTKSGGSPARVSPIYGANEIIIPGTSAISRDGKRIAFITVNVFSSLTTLYYYQATNGISPQAIQVDREVSPNTVPAFSPDGKKLAYFKQQLDISGDPTPGTEGFTIADISTDNIVLNDLSPTLPPFTIDGTETIDWSPDGSELLLSADLTQFLYTNGLVQKSSYIHGTFSPDGKRIAYVGADDQLYIEVRETPIGKIPLTVSADSIVRYPCWSPDGKKIVYSSLLRSDDNFNASLKTIEVADPSTVRELVTNGVARGFWMTREGL